MTERVTDKTLRAPFAQAMRDTPNFGSPERAGRVAAACPVRAQDGVAVARWTEFDLERGVWSLHPSRTKMNWPIDIPLAAPVMRSLEEVQLFSWAITVQHAA